MWKSFALCGHCFVDDSVNAGKVGVTEAISSELMGNEPFLEHTQPSGCADTALKLQSFHAAPGHSGSQSLKVVASLVESKVGSNRPWWKNTLPGEESFSESPRA